MTLFELIGQSLSTITFTTQNLFFLSHHFFYCGIDVRFYDRPQFFQNWLCDFIDEIFIRIGKDILRTCILVKQFRRADFQHIRNQINYIRLGKKDSLFHAVDVAQSHVNFKRQLILSQPALLSKIFQVFYKSFFYGHAINMNLYSFMKTDYLSLNYALSVELTIN